MATQPNLPVTYTRTGPTAAAANEALIRDHMPLVRRIAPRVIVA